MTPRVTEFGGTFGSDLGGIAVAHDGSVWVNERDRMAHVERDGRVREYRVPVDVYQGRPGPAGRIGVGPRGDVWFEGEGYIGRMTAEGRMRLYDVMPRGQQRNLTAFAVSPNGLWLAYFNGVRGVVHIDGRGARTSSDSDLESVDAIAPTADGALWITASSRSKPGRLAIAYRSPGGARRFVADVTAQGVSVLGATPSGALVTATRDWSARRARVERWEPDGQVRTLTSFGVEGYGEQIGAAAFARDGTTWLAEPARNRLVRIAPNGSIGDVRRGLPPSASPLGVAADDAGGVWFTDVADGLVGHAAANGTIAVIGHGPIPEATPADPAVASDGAVWYRETFAWRQRLARLAPDGTLREFPDVGSGPLLARGRDVLTSTSQGIVAVAPDGSQRTIAPSVIPHAPTAAVTYALVDPAGAASSPDGAAWYAVDGAIVRVGLDGAVRVVPTPGLRADSIAFDAQGTLWFTDTYRSLLGSVTPHGRVRTHTRGLTRWHSGPQRIVRGPDGAMWFTEVRDRIGRIASDGRITEFARGIPYRSSLGGIAPGPDGALWFTLWHGNVLGRITTDGRVTLRRGLVTPSRGHEQDPDAVLASDRHGGYWFPESQGGRLAHLTFH